MIYVQEFEFYESNGFVTASPCGGFGEGTFGDDFEDAVESAADWLSETVNDCLMGRGDLPQMEFGHEPAHGGKIIAVAVSRELSDIPAMTAAETACALGVSSDRVSQLISFGLLDSWKDGAERMVSRASVEAWLEYASKSGRS